MNRCKPTRYELALEPDLDQLTFTGRVVIHFSCKEPVQEIDLDAVDLSVASVTAKRGGEDLSVEWSGGAAGLKLSFPTAVSDEVAISIDYSGEINDLMAGFYRSRYRLADEERFLAVTQFEERDARRAFPCIDEPAAKATFAITITAPDGTVAISNERVTAREPLSDGRTRFHFAETPPLSTYLVFFAVGPFEVTEDTSWRIPVSVAVSPGHGRYTARALEYARKSLSYLEEFTGVEYPLSKLDSIGVEDFAFGAMENFGAISYRENFLLDIPGTTTRRNREKQMGIAAHEIAHMWFGDLVSPAAWRFVWLNEAFATYLGNTTTDHWFPHWRTMDQFVRTSQATAMTRDSYPNTIPIEFDRDEIEIDVSTAPIVYQKGANLLRMVRAFYGDDAFANACTVYLKQYQFGSATSEQFLHSFGGALSAGGEPAAGLLSGWIRNPGLPLVRVERSGPRVQLSQERFLLTGDQIESDLWSIPISGTTPSGLQVRELLTTRQSEFTVDGNADWLWLNTNQTGYYRVFFEDDGEWDRLASAASSGYLNELDRYGILSDLAAFVNAGLVTLDRYLELAKAFGSDETSYVVLDCLADSLLELYELSDHDERIAAAGRDILGSHAEGLLREPTEEEPYTNVLLRDPVLWTLARFGDGSVTDRLSTAARALARGDALHPDLVPVAMRVWAHSDSGSLDWIEEQIAGPDTPEARKVSLISALSGAARDDQADRVLRFLLYEVPPRNLGYFLRSGARALEFRERLWSWFSGNFATLESIHPMILGSAFLYSGAYGGIGRSGDVADFISEYRSGSPRVDSGVLELVIDRLAANEALRARVAAVG